MIKEIFIEQEKQEICSQILEQLPDWFGLEDAINDYLANLDNCKFLAYILENTYIGFIAVKEVSQKDLDIYVMGIKKEYHRQGIGKKLMGKVKHFAQKNHYNNILVKTLSDKHPDHFYAQTRAFYTSQGFKPFKESLEWGKENPCLILRYTVR